MNSEVFTPTSSKDHAREVFARRSRSQDHGSRSELKGRIGKDVANAGLTFLLPDDRYYLREFIYPIDKRRSNTRPRYSLHNFKNTDTTPLSQNEVVYDAPSLEVTTQDDLESYEEQSQAALEDALDMIEQAESYGFDVESLSPDELQDLAKELALRLMDERAERYATVGLDPNHRSTGRGTKKDFTIDGWHGDEEEPDWASMGFSITDRP